MVVGGEGGLSNQGGRSSILGQTVRGDLFPRIGGQGGPPVQGTVSPATPVQAL